MSLASKVFIGVVCGLGLAYLSHRGEEYDKVYAKEQADLKAAVTAPIDRSQQWASKERAFRLDNYAIACEYKFQLDRISSIAEAGAFDGNTVAHEGCVTLNKGAIVLAAGNWTPSDDMTVFSGSQMMAMIGETPMLVYVMGTGRKAH